MCWEGCLVGGGGEWVGWLEGRKHKEARIGRLGRLPCCSSTSNTSTNLSPILMFLTPRLYLSHHPPTSHTQVDLDYDNLSRPPPAPTEEATHSLEDMIKRRIADARWGGGGWGGLHPRCRV